MNSLNILKSHEFLQQKHMDSESRSKKIKKLIKLKLQVTVKGAVLLLCTPSTECPVLVHESQVVLLVMYHTHLSQVISSTRWDTPSLGGGLALV